MQESIGVCGIGQVDMREYYYLQRYIWYRSLPLSEFIIRVYDREERAYSIYKMNPVNLECCLLHGDSVPLIVIWQFSSLLPWTRQPFFFDLAFARGIAVRKNECGLASFTVTGHIRSNTGFQITIHMTDAGNICVAIHSASGVTERYLAEWNEKTYDSLRDLPVFGILKKYACFH